MLQLKNISLYRGQKPLLEKADLTLFVNQKVGFIGANGAGKTSLFLMLQNQIQPEDGEVLLSADLRLVCLSQEIIVVDDSVLDYVLMARPDYVALQNKLKIAEQNNDGESMADIHHQLAELNAYSLPSDAAVILKGLGFSQAEIERPMASFSGGWQMRMNLARVLLTPADMILLDEPTNHLDLEAIIWLEAWLRKIKQTVLIISHDREFLDRVVTHIVHLDQQQLTLYTGSYSSFEKQRAEHLRLQQATFEKQALAKKHLQSYVDRFRYKASKAKQAQSRIKMLERMEDVLPVRMQSPFNFAFKQPGDAGNPLLSLRHVDIGYSDKPILKDVGLSLLPGDRLGLIGLNGAGKSTLIKCLAGELSALKGDLQFSQKINIGYFSQHQLELLDEDESAFHHVQKIDKKLMEREIRQYLGGFNFQGDQVFQPVGEFSGGEKARLVLALMIWHKPNLLLLDEPTNHLDLEMREALVLALQSFSGAVVVVSHDRYLLNTVVDQFYLVANGAVVSFDGDLNDYQEVVRNTGNKPAPVKVEKKSALSHKQKKERESLLNKLEKQLAKKEARLIEVDALLADPALYSDAGSRLNDLQAERESLALKITELESALLELYG